MGEVSAVDRTKVHSLIDKVYSRYYVAINELTKQKNNFQVQLQRLLEAVKSGFDPALIADEANSIKEQINSVNLKIKHLKSNPPSQLSVSEEEIKNFFNNFMATFNNATIPERKKLIRTFVRHLELDPKNNLVRVSFYPDQVVHSIGVGDGT